MEKGAQIIREMWDSNSIITGFAEMNSEKVTWGSKVQLLLSLVGPAASHPTNQPCSKTLFQNLLLINLSLFFSMVVLKECLSRWEDGKYFITVLVSFLSV